MSSSPSFPPPLSLPPSPAPASGRAAAQSDAASPPGQVQSAVPPLLPVLLVLVVAAIVLGGVFAWLSPGGSAASLLRTARFTDVTEESGLHFVHQQGGNASPTTLGGAVVVLDYDNDGNPDLFFVNGAPWPWDEPLTKRVNGSTCALYHNDGKGHFTDVTALAGLNVELQGMSATAGDFDNDGLVDIFVTCVGTNHLFRNRGNGRFEDVTEQAGVGGEENTWSTSATWIDYDGDGRLDLVVAHYARWPVDVPLALAFSIADVGRTYGAPTGFITAFPSVYRNLGGGRFELVPGSAGLRDIDRQTGLPVAKALAVIPLDANGDGLMDLLFSYHTNEHALFLNRGDGTFRKWNASRDNRHEGSSAGIASPTAFPSAQDGGADERFLALQNFTGQDSRGREEAQLNLSSKFGIATLDYDLDGQLQIFSGAGRAERDVNKFEGERGFQSTPQLFWRVGNSWTTAPGGWSKLATVRGVAVADFDGDGDLDVVLAQNEGPPILLRNDQRLGHPWLRIRLIGTRGTTDAGGAQVEVHTPRRVFVQTLAPAMGFMAQSEATLTFGLGEDARVRKVVVHWPSGQRQELRPESINRTLVIREP